MQALCRCGCDFSRHQHYHYGEYCGTCPGCWSFVPRRRFRWQFWRQP